MTRLFLIPAFMLVLLVAAGNSLAGALPTNGTPQKLVHNWDCILFAPTLLPDDKGRPNFMVNHWINSDLASPGLRLNIMNLRPASAFFKSSPITAKLHRANGEIVEPTEDGKMSLKGRFGAGSGGVHEADQTMTRFPPGSNTLEECWIEVSISPERYWLEIPYGFDRDGTEPLAPSFRGGNPRFIPAMKLLTEHDHVMRWQNVHYDLGHAQNGYRLTLIQSNPGDAESRVDVYAGVRLNVASPRPIVRIVDSSGTVRNGTDVDIHLNDDSIARTDTFRFDRYPGDLRSWGQIEVSVNGESFRVVVPSSLYKSTHGHAAKPALIAFLAALRAGMTPEEADRASGNYIAEGIRHFPLASDPHRYRYVFPSDPGEVTLLFDKTDNLVSWGTTAPEPR